MLSNAVYIQGHTFLSMKQHKSLGKKPQPNKQTTEHREKSGPRTKKLPRKKSAKSGPSTDCKRTSSMNTEFFPYKYLLNLSSSSFLYYSHFP